MSSFAELRDLTNARAQTHTFTDEDIQSILFPSDGTLSSSTVQTEDLSRKLSYLMTKEIRLQLHGITLSEYVRAKRIPQGLRLHKIPSLGRNSEEFCTKWCEILNKASLDLMVLIIEHTHQELAKTKNEVEEIKGEITKTLDAPAFQKLQENIAMATDKYREKELKKKIKKFKRDTFDYRDNKVYEWRLNKPDVRPRRQVHFQETPHTSESSASEYPTDSEQDFLEDDESSALRGPPRPNDRGPPRSSEARRHTRYRRNDAGGNVARDNLRRSERRPNKSRP